MHGKIDKVIAPHGKAGNHHHRHYHADGTPCDHDHDHGHHDHAHPAAVPVRTAPKVGRNDPCTCGSGQKSKRCCMA